MAHQALYRKWRSQTFNEIVGQDHVTRTLQNALHAGRMSHAYLFTGPRGTGKTSTARILAKAFNCLAPLEERPCDECRMCVSIREGNALDLIEIDAASNTSVDDVRDLREKVNFAPSEGRYKIYIIDEVHMLSNSAFNALLKTLEEPPEHVVFVLATTEVHRVPATVLSRCQRFDFHRISVDKMVQHMASILDEEGIDYEQEALETLAWQATGSLRDALSLLDQLIASGRADLTVTVQVAREVLGLPDSESVSELVDALLVRDTGRGLAIINTVLGQGTDARQFLVALLDHLRALLLVAVDGHDQLGNLPEELVQRMQEQARSIRPGAIVAVIRAFHGAGSDLKLGLQPQLPLELAFVEAVLKLQEQNGSAPETSAQTHAKRTVRETPASNQNSAHRSRVEQTAASTSTSDDAATAVVTEESDGQKAQTERYIAGDVGPAESSSSAADKMKRTTEPAVAQHGTDEENLQSETDSDVYGIEWWQQEWPEFLDWLKDQGPKGKRLAIRLKFGRPHAVKDETLLLQFAYSIHKDKVEEQETRTLLQRAIKKYTNVSLRVDCVWIPNEEHSVPAKTKYQMAAEDPIVREALKLGGRIVDVRIPSAQ